MKQGARFLGVAESYRGEEGDTSYLAGAVVRADGALEDLTYVTATVGGTDATDAVVRLYDRLGREDVRAVVVSGVALAWYNIVDLRAVHDATGVPVVSVTYEDGDDLRNGIRDAFDADACDERLAVYDALPDRRALDDVYVRSVGVEPDRADDWIRALTDDDATRPEPARVARTAARALLGFSADSPAESDSL